MIALTPEPPYYAVIFTSLRTSQDDAGYTDMAMEMEELATTQEGFLGLESARKDTGITVSYWSSMEAIKAWKENGRHLVAQRMGKEKWYSAYKLRICKVERDYEFTEF